MRAKQSSNLVTSRIRPATDNCGGDIAAVLTYGLLTTELASDVEVSVMHGKAE